MREVFRTDEDGIDVEVELEIDAMQREFPWLFSLFIKYDFKSKDEDAQEEFLEMKESIILTLEKNSLVKYVGMRDIDGWIELYFYALNSKNLLHSIKKFLEQNKLIFEHGVVRDTKWDFYTANLMPNELEYCFMESSKIVELLKEEGDIQSELREVEHYAMFDTDSQKQRFIDSMLTEGFVFKDDISTDECSHGVALVKIHNLEEESLRKVISQLFDGAKKEHGFYELWSTTLVENFFE